MELIGVDGREADGGHDGTQSAAGPDGVAELVRAQLPWMLSVARAITGNLDSAEALLQEAVVRALPHADSWRSSPRPYLRRTMTNLHIDQLRRLRLIDFVPESEFPQQSMPPVDVDLKVDVERSLAAMPPILRLVLVYRFLEDLSAVQVAELIGQSPGSVRRLTHQGLSMLRRDTSLAATRSAHREGKK